MKNTKNKFKTLSFVLLTLILIPSMLLLVSCKKGKNNNSVPSNASYTVVFDSKCETTVESLTNLQSGAKITKPDEITKEDYTFIGWYNGNEEWNFEENTVNADLTLTAKWQHKFFFFDEDNSTITGLTDLGKEESNVVIPEKINDVEVLVIGENAFL